MKKIPFFLVLIFIISCDKNEDLTSKSQTLNNPMQLYIINGDIEYYSEITDGSKPKKPIFVYDIPNPKNDTKGNAISKTSQESVTLNFNYGIEGSTKSGCTIKRYDDNKSYYTDYGVYGPTPYNKNGYLIRGYGSPHHNFDYNSLILQTSNKGIKHEEQRTDRIINQNLSTISAISIEYPFKANVTYEISIKTLFKDNRKMINNVQSSGFPTLSAALQDSGILFGGITTCEKSYRQIGVTVNYLKSYTLGDNVLNDKIITYKFSPTEVKNALSFTLTPHTGGRGVNVPIPTNSYTMALKSVTITEKPFDPSLNIISERPPGR